VELTARIHTRKRAGSDSGGLQENAEKRLTKENLHDIVGAGVRLCAFQSITYRYYKKTSRVPPVVGYNKCSV
jgi:hypothetical protein